jgi:hypothetical protein
MSLSKLFETIFSGLKGEELGRGGRKEGLTVCSDGAVPLLFEASWNRLAATTNKDRSPTIGPVVKDSVKAQYRKTAAACCLSFASWHWASRISVSSSSVGWDCVASGSNISVGRAHCSRTRDGVEPARGYH